MIYKSLTLDLPDTELILWDGGTGTAHMLARGMYLMSPRTKAITRALLLLALEEIEKEDTE